VLGLSATAAAPPRLATYREFFVSHTGSDQSGSASEGFPFKTLEKARDEVRKVIPDMTGDVVVTIRGGIYPVSRTFVFGPDDSGRGTHRVIYRAANGETPVFSGGVPVTGWTLHKGNIWQAPLNRDCKLRALYVNDQRAVMTSRKVSPEGPWGEYIVTAGQAPWAWQSGRAADGVIYNISDLPAITRNPLNVEIENKTTWNENFVGVREITIESNHYVFKFQQPYGAIAQQIGWNAGFAFRRDHIIQNAYELLDHPGEFYFDQAAKTLYYIPRPGEDMSTVQVVAPVTETLLRIEGQPLKRPVRNLTFEGLRLW
jgi:hypothetical protein